MNVILLNWSGAEGDPFTLFNKNLQARFTDVGCRSFVLEVTNHIENELLEIKKKWGRIDLVITHQGIYTNFKSKNNNNLWEELGVKLVSLSSDHPCHMPANHSEDNKYVLHTYCTTSFNKYANLYFKRYNPTLLLNTPAYFSKKINKYERGGEYFVFPKNLDSIDGILQTWKKYGDHLYKILSSITEEIKSDILSGSKRDHHDVANEFLENIEVSTDQYGIINFKFISDGLLNASDMSLELFHFIHGQIDKIYRNYFAEFVVRELKDFPLQINGRGWDSFFNFSKNHKYNNINDIADLDSQFYSKFGILDVVPVFDSGHDRIGRSIQHGSGFLSSCGLNYTQMLGTDKFEKLFFSGQKNQLVEKAARVIEEPSVHRELAVEFGEELQGNGSFEGFYLFLYEIYRS